MTRTSSQVSPNGKSGWGDHPASPRTPPPVPSPFLRLFSMLALSALAYVPQWVFGDRKDYRIAFRHGMAAGFIWSGVDHFVSTQTRYVPMLPTFLTPHGVELVYGTGVLELAGAVGLVVPLAVYRRLGLPNLRKWAGIGIAILLAGLMVANVHVAIAATSGKAFAFEAWTYWLRLLFQPVFMVWALYAAGVIRRGPGVASPEAPARGGMV
jgi:uncharacterized membrane protein